jgi:branched-chain amino acid transport system substrate-binding protein
MVSEDALVTAEFWSIAGPAGEGTLMTFQPDPRKLDSAKSVVEKFKSAGYDPEGYTLYTYAAFQVFKAAAEAAGSTDTKAVAEAIRGKTFDTVIGKLTYNDIGDVLDPEYVWYIWTNGTYKETGSM